MSRTMLVAWTVLCGISFLTAAPAAETTPERFLVYKVERIAAADAPTIDGALTEAVWQDKAVLTDLRNYRGDLVGEIQTQPSEFIIVTDGAKLYIAATLHEKNMKSLAFNPAYNPWGNDSVEILLDPRHDATCKIQMNVDCGAQKSWYRQYSDSFGWRTDGGWWALARWEVAVARTATAWTLEAAIDCASFGIDPSPGKVCGMNVCRFRYTQVPWEWAAWGFNTSEGQKAMSAWGHLLFAPPGEHTKGIPVTRADISTVYSDLTNRVIGVPTAGGFAVYTDDGERHVTYAELLTKRVATLDAQLRDAQGILGQIPASGAVSDLTTQVTTTVKDLDEIKMRSGSPDLTLGGYDKLVDQLAKAQLKADRVYWRARLLLLMATGEADPQKAGPCE